MHSIIIYIKKLEYTIKNLKTMNLIFKIQKNAQKCLEIFFILKINNIKKKFRFVKMSLTI